MWNVGVCGENMAVITKIFHNEHYWALNRLLQTLNILRISIFPDEMYGYGLLPCQKMDVLIVGMVDEKISVC